MQIEITNNWLIVPDGDLISANIKSLLSFYEKSRKVNTNRGQVTVPPKISYAYTIVDNKIYIPVGLYSLLSDCFTLDVEVLDHRICSNPKLLDVNACIENINAYENVLPGITLKRHQLLAIRKILYHKRGIINSCTGSGKTEMMIATIKILTQLNDGVCPTVLVFEPTIKLVNDTVKRFKQYDVDAVAYSKNRKILPNTVNITHPKSLGNDLQENTMLLDDVEILFGDESHHMQADMYRLPTYSMSNLVYSIGVSASAISQDHVGCKKVNQYSYNEVLTIGATGSLLINITPEHLIARGDLANPILFRVKYEATEYLSDLSKTDWNCVSKVHLQSDKRNHLICRLAENFAKAGRKVLILVNTVEWSRKLLEMFSAMGDYNLVFASYGGGKLEKVTNEWHPQFISGESDCFDRFDSGEYKILIGTTHLYEGADIKNLDVIILAYGGNAERLQVQGLGRALRKTKTGKYAYVIDFTDDNDLVLSKHSKTRLKRYRDIIGIPKDNIYDCIDESKVDAIFRDREGL